MKILKSKTKNNGLEWQNAIDVKKDINKVLKVLGLTYVKSSRIFCYRTNGSKSKSYARIWAFPKIFQNALGLEPAYVIEVLSKHYDKLDEDEQKMVLIHELLHIPKNFSGALIPHRTRSRHLDTQAKILFKQYKELVK